MSVKLTSFEQVFSGEYPLVTWYEFTPDQAHDPAQVDRPYPRVKVALDEYPVTDGSSILMTSFDGANTTDQLPDHVAAALLPVSNRLVVHMRDRLAKYKLGLLRVTRVISEGSVKGPHELLVPVWERQDPKELWERQYADGDRATPEQIAVMLEVLQPPDELKEELDQILGEVYWVGAAALGPAVERPDQ